MKNKLRQWFIPFIEKHVRTYHTGCDCIEGRTTENGIEKIYYDDKVWIEEEA